MLQHCLLSIYAIVEREIIGFDNTVLIILCLGKHRGQTKGQVQNTSCSCAGRRLTETCLLPQLATSCSFGPTTFHISLFELILVY